MERFVNRTDAGRQLALRLKHVAAPGCVVYGVARGGVVVGFEVAIRLDAPLDVVVVRKLGHPRRPEYACGAVTAAGDLVVKDSVGAEVPAAWLEAESKRAVIEAARRESVYTAGREPIPANGKVAIVVDDGIATGLTTRATLLAIRRLGAVSIIVATPVASPLALEDLSGVVDEIIAVHTPPLLSAIGQAYVDFTQVTDADVVSCLDIARRRDGLRRKDI